MFKKQGNRGMEESFESLNWQLSYNPKLGQVKGILLLSYKDLPFYLKHCFLYCCMFHYCSQIKRKKLIRLWVAEGFVKERKGILWRRKQRSNSQSSFYEA